jgi:hypothetical protein
MPAGFSVEGDFDGTVSAKELVGKFKHKEGGEEAVHLLRTRSYWDK